MIVVCSIHQPRSNIFSLFDKVLLLNKGKTVYYGARGSIVKYFETLGALCLYQQLAVEYQPSRLILDMTTSSQKLRDGKPLHEAYQHHMARPTTAKERLDMTVPTESTISKTRDRLKDSGSMNSKWMTSFWYQPRCSCSGRASSRGRDLQRREPGADLRGGRDRVRHLVSKR
ncbi:unnamed protein product [Ascophyllum nodosum]